jgi:hypothetical protein
MLVKICSLVSQMNPTWVGFPAESMFTFTGIPTSRSAEENVA